MSQRYLLWFLGGVSVIIISYFVLFPQVWYCQWVGYSDFKALTPHFYVSPKSSAKHHQYAQKVVAEAQKRIESFWGSRQGKPTIIVCYDPQEYAKFCHSDEGAGCSIGTPWGASYVVLNLDGINTDVIAHEMCHDELFTRLGWWKTTQQIPQWFNEGLALMVDYRFVENTTPAQRYLAYKDECDYVSSGGQVVLTLAEISSMRGFFTGPEGRVMLAYMTSGREVARWLSITGQAAIPQLVQLIQEGYDFNEAYTLLETKKQ